ncbi:MAG: alkylmercury lyase family protein [Promethearchaeota archaeon]
MESKKHINIQPESSDKTKIIFQDACTHENLDAKFGLSLSNEENRIRYYILTQTPILGRIPLIDEIKGAFGNISNDTLSKIINHLDEVDAIHLDENKTKIEAVYPFSGPKTDHLIKFKEEPFKNVYAMCAIDALGMPFMLSSDIEINSRCFHCDDEINIEIVNYEITSIFPKNLVVWGHMEYSCCAATSLCNNINFFSSEQHFEEWEEKVGKKKGYLLQIQEAFYLGKLFFEKRLNI